MQMIGHDYPEATARFARMVRENITPSSHYESEGSERRTLGSIPISADAHWSATVTVPIDGADVAFIELARQGALPASYLGAGASVLLSLPTGEVDTVIALLTGVIAHARRDGVLPLA